MTEINKDKTVATLINVFFVEPENQQKLVEVLIEATNKVIRNQKGFVSVNIHKSAVDGRITCTNG